MRVISEEKLIKLAFRIDDHNTVVSLDDALAECQELQEPWMTLDEFLKSGFRGKCWIAFKDKTVVDSIFVEGQFFESEVDSDGYRGSFRLKNITHIRPIHTPEPPI